MDIQTLYHEWLSSPVVDEATKAELRAAASDGNDLEDRFYRELEFGTAGLRGVLGAGTNRMNVYVVRRATQGLADYLADIPGAKKRSVAIAYDSRHGSKEFAAETAMVLAGNGIHAYLFSTLHSVPQLSFALQRLSCIAGVVITASHNPKNYNGYKVYWEYGGQCAPEQAAAIYENIGRVPMFVEKRMALADAKGAGLVTMLGADEDEAYYKATAELLLCPELLRTYGPQLSIVYTPLHGTGNVPVTTLLARVGVTNVSVVPEQQLPDGDFPTVKAPNPEDPDAFRLAIALAEKQGATVCLATDPDADRLGIAVKTRAGAWTTLTGNEIGCLLLLHILSHRKEAGTLPNNGVVIKSIVSTTLADAICAAYGVALENVMTGFRFIGEKIDAYAKSGEKTFLFGFEESYGFLAGGLSRDKDAVCSAMLAAEACADCLSRGVTLFEQLESIYHTYGYYKEKVKSYTVSGKAGMEQIAACMEALLNNPPASIGGHPVEATENYRTLTCTAADGGTTAIDQPRSNMVRFLLGSGVWIVVRPSGTEPKLKLYIGANEKDEATVDALLQTLFADIDGRILELLG